LLNQLVNFLKEDSNHP